LGDNFLKSFYFETYFGRSFTWVVKPSGKYRSSVGWRYCDVSSWPVPLLSPVRAFLLAAGFGTRLKPITDNVPKCLVPVGGQPLLDYWLDALDNAGIGPIVINLHYHANQVEAFLETRANRSRIEQVFEPELLGTGGALKANRKLLGTEPVMVIHSDNLCLSNIRAFADAHLKRPKHTAITMMTFISDMPQQCGIVELDKEGTAIALHEKVPDPPGNIANAAVYVFEPEVIDFICSHASKFIDLSTEILPHYVGRIYTWPANGLHIDIGTLPNLARANTLMG
jgi:mannose-1-phosphate guanylyltransferase